MSLWIVLVNGLWRSCYECSGGGNADFYFVAAPSRREAMDMVLAHRLADDPYDWRREEEKALREDSYLAVAIRPWRGKQRMVARREVEL